MKKILVLISLFGVSFAQGTTETVHPVQSTECVKTCSPCEDRIPDMCPHYNHSARIDTRCSWDVFVWGKFLYWQPREEGLDIVSFHADNNGNTTGLIEMNFDYKPGFKVGAGANFDHDEWVGYAEYTWLHLTDSMSATAPDGGHLNAGPLWLNNLTNDGLSVNAKWNLKLDYLDAGLSRPYYLGRRLTIAGFCGARAAWLRQRVSGTFVAQLVAPFFPLDTDSRSKSWRIGPRAGLMSFWNLGCGFNLTGNIAMNILYTDYKIKYVADQFLNGVFTPNAFDAKIKIKYLRPWAEMGLGINWGTYLNQDRFHLDFSAEYDFHVLWSENVLIGYPIRMGNLPFNPTDLYIHGLTLTARFDF